MEDILESLKNIVIAVIVLYVIAQIAIAFAQTLGQSYGIFTEAGYVVSIVVGLIDGKIVENPKRVIFYGVGYAICAAASNAAMSFVSANWRDPLVMLIGLAVICILWYRGKMLRDY